MDNKKPNVRELDELGKQIVVCGATGFIGSYLVMNLLEYGYTNIHIISRTMSSCEALESLIAKRGLKQKYERYVSIHFGELMSYQWLCEVVKGCSLLYNCASQVNLSAEVGDLIANNTRLTYLIAECAKECGVDRVVHVSSISTLEEQVAPALTCEEHYLKSLNGKSAYTCSKFYSENEMWRVYYEGVNVTVVSPSVVLGAPAEGMSHSSAAIVRRVQRGVRFYTDGTMGYVLVDDVARAMITLSKVQEAVGQRFILNGANLSYKNFLSMLSSSVGRSSSQIKLPRWLVRSAAVLCKLLRGVGVRSSLSVNLANTLTSHYLYDGSKITKCTSFTYTDMEEGIKKIGSMLA